MPYIPASAIKFYTASSGGTLVTSGSGNAVIYPRVSDFTEPETGMGIWFPHEGLATLSGTRTIRTTDNGIIRDFTLTLPGKYKQGWLSYSGAWSGVGSKQWITGGWSIPGGAGSMDFEITTNGDYIGMYGDIISILADAMGSSIDTTFYSWKGQDELIPISGTSTPYGNFGLYTLYFTINSPINRSTEDISYPMYLWSGSTEVFSMTVLKKGTSQFFVQYANRTSSSIMTSVYIDDSYLGQQYSDAYLGANDSSQSDYITGYNRVSDSFTITVFTNTSKAINISVDGGGYEGGYDATPRTSRIFNISKDFTSLAESNIWVYYD